MSDRVVAHCLRRSLSRGDFRFLGGITRQRRPGTVVALFKPNFSASIDEWIMLGGDHQLQGDGADLAKVEAGTGQRFYSTGAVT